MRQDDKVQQTREHNQGMPRELLDFAIILQIHKRHKFQQFLIDWRGTYFVEFTRNRLAGWGLCGREKNVALR
jgi:hypothetical protein